MSDYFLPKVIEDHAIPVSRRMRRITPGMMAPAPSMLDQLTKTPTKRTARSVTGGNGNDEQRLKGVHTEPFWTLSEDDGKTILVNYDHREEPIVRKRRKK